MKLNTKLIQSIARAYGIEVDTKRQRIQGANLYKYCIWETNGTYIGGWYPSCKMARVDCKPCFTFEDFTNALEEHIYGEANV